MKNFWVTGLLFLIASSASFAAGQAQPKPGQRQFARGRQLVQANCVDCMGGNRAGLEEGIRQIDEALKAGYPNQKTAYRLLLNAYDDLETYTEKDPPAHQACAEKRSEILKKLVELSPRDPEVLKTYADSLQNPEEKAAVLAKVVQLNPNLANARYQLGVIIAQQGKTAEGIQMVQEAIARQGDPDALRSYVLGLINLLDEAKCPLPDAEQWNARLDEAYNKATQGGGNPVALSDFRKGFLEAVGKQPCANAPQKD